MTRVLFSFILSMAVITGFAQTPQALNYQAVARNSSGLILPTTNINVRFSILDGSATGTVIYQETHATSTNNFGLFTLSIGKGIVVSGNFANINWATGLRFLKVEIDPAGGSNYVLQGATQFLSVPYSLYAEKTNLVAGTGINITGNTISTNLVAGPGININGNTISSTAGQWLTDPNGIHYSAGKVGIGMNADPIIPLSVFANSTNNGYAALQLVTNDNWHTALIMRNGAVPNQYTMIVGGPGNTEVFPRNFGIFNHNYGFWGFVMSGTTNNIGIGYSTIAAQAPRSKLHVFNGDVNIENIGSGIILKSPNGQCWRITIDNAGNLVRTAITCP